MHDAERAKPGWSDPYRLYVLLAPLFYLAFALLTPPFETPDEHQHLFRAWQLASFELVGERRGVEAGGDLPPGLARAAQLELGSSVPHADRPVPKTGWSERFDRTTSPGLQEKRTFTNFLGSASYSPVGYVPQVLAVWGGEAAGLSVENVVRLGRVLNAALAFALLCCAFRALPSGRLVLLVIGLLPMTAACAGSFGQDGLVIGGSAWLVALGLRAVLVRQWSRAAGVGAVVLAIAVTLAKFVYLPLAGLGLFLRGRDGRLRVAAPPLLAGLLAGLLLLLWLRLTAGLSVPMMPGRPQPAEQLHYILQHPSAFPSALASTLNFGGVAFLWGTLSKFGWVNIGPVPLASALSLIGLLVAAWAGDEAAAGLGRAWRAWVLALCGVVIVLLCLALYLAATALGAEVVFGLQGRYFIPLLLPIALACLPGRQIAVPGLSRSVAATMVFANIAALHAIVHAYYV